jgi:hypothetical protein
MPSISPIREEESAINSGDYEEEGMFFRPTTPQILAQTKESKFGTTIFSKEASESMTLTPDRKI